MYLTRGLSMGAVGAIPVLDVPSGQSVELVEVLVDQVGTETWLRFRFLAPAIAREGGNVNFVQAEGDLEYLCTQVALPYIADYDLAADIVSITLLDRPVAFGTSDQAATQFIDLFRITSETCVWEGG